VVHKDGKLRCYFTKDSEDAFFHSQTFNRILEYLKHHPDAAQLQQARGGLVLKFDSIKTAKDILWVLKPLREFVYREIEEPVEHQS
jgi:hypothetical protein